MDSTHENDEVPLSERPVFRWIESVEDVALLFGDAQAVFNAICNALEEQVSAQDDERSAEMKGE